jgi:D-3-phosphoglycerate dehydrogenase
MPSVALLETIGASVVPEFGAAGYDAERFPGSVSQDDLIELSQENLAIGIRSLPEIREDVLRRAGMLQAIGCYCIGTNQIDLDVATEQGIAVFNSRYENTRSVAEHTVSNIISLFRRTHEHDRSLHAGVWSKTEARSYEARNKILGIVGYGSIGSQVSILGEALGMRVRYYDPMPRVPRYGRAKRVESLEELLRVSDVVTLHVPSTPETKYMINDESLRHLKQGSYLINTARGDVVDYPAVVRALQDDRLYGVAADVFEDEPRKRGDTFEHPLLQVPGKVLLTPHIAGSTVESQEGIARDTTAKLLGYLATGNSVGAVNMPELDLSPLPESVTRVLHLHHNRPGALASIISTISEQGLNISAQKLETKGHLGYAAVDVEGDVSELTGDDLFDIDGTIRLRVLRNDT